MKEFPELRGVSAENLLYVKEDLIIPHVRAHVVARAALWPCALNGTSPAGSTTPSTS